MDPESKQQPRISAKLQDREPVSWCHLYRTAINGNGKNLNFPTSTGLLGMEVCTHSQSTTMATQSWDLSASVMLWVYCSNYRSDCSLYQPACPYVPTGTINKRYAGLLLRSVCLSVRSWSTASRSEAMDRKWYMIVSCECNRIPDSLPSSSSCLAYFLSCRIWFFFVLPDQQWSL